MRESIAPERFSAFALIISHIFLVLTFSAFPETPTKVPLLVYSFWEADNETDNSEKGAPKTSNRASVKHKEVSKLLSQISVMLQYRQNLQRHPLSC